MGDFNLDLFKRLQSVVGKFEDIFLSQGLYPLRPEGGVKVDFPVFTYLIRAAGDEQEEKNRTEI